MYDRGSVFLLVGEEGGFEEGEGIFFFACWAWAFLLVWGWERGRLREVREGVGLFASGG